MDAKPPVPQGVWEHTPVVAQEYIRTLEARVTTLEAVVQHLEATVQHLTERLRRDSRTSSRPLRAICHRQPGNGHAASPAGVARADNPATWDRRERSSRWRRWMW